MPHSARFARLARRVNVVVCWGRVGVCVCVLTCVCVRVCLCVRGRVNMSVGVHGCVCERV